VLAHASVGQDTSAAAVPYLAACRIGVSGYVRAIAGLVDLLARRLQNVLRADTDD
jgi:hypothetical protein